MGVSVIVLIVPILLLLVGIGVVLAIKAFRK